MHPSVEHVRRSFTSNAKQAGDAPFVGRRRALDIDFAELLIEQSFTPANWITPKRNFSLWSEIQLTHEWRKYHGRSYQAAREDLKKGKHRASPPRPFETLRQEYRSPACDPRSARLEQRAVGTRLIQVKADGSCTC
jgi:hypothetical protein